MRATRRPAAASPTRGLRHGAPPRRCAANSWGDSDRRAVLPRVAPLAVLAHLGHQVVIRVAADITGGAVANLEVKHIRPAAVHQMVRIPAATAEAGAHAGGERGLPGI